MVRKREIENWKGYQVLRSVKIDNTICCQVGAKFFYFVFWATCQSRIICNDLIFLISISFFFFIIIIFFSLKFYFDGRTFWCMPWRLISCLIFSNGVLQTLDIVAENPDKFRVVAIAAGSNVTLLADQVTVRYITYNRTCNGLIWHSLSCHLIIYVLICSCWIGENIQTSTSGC